MKKKIKISKKLSHPTEIDVEHGWEPSGQKKVVEWIETFASENNNYLIWIHDENSNKGAEEYIILPDQTLMLPEKTKKVNEDYWSFAPPLVMRSLN